MQVSSRYTLSFPLCSLFLSCLGYCFGPRVGKCPSCFPTHTGSLCVDLNWREVTFEMRSRSVRKNVKAFMLSHGINIKSLSPPTLALFLSLPPSLSLLSLPPLFLLLDCLSVCLCLCARVLATDRREGSRECVLTRVCARVHAWERVWCACWQAEVEGGTDWRRKGGKKPREIEERSDEGREAEYKHLPLVPLFCGNRPRRLPFERDEAKRKAVSLEHWEVGVKRRE